MAFNPLVAQGVLQRVRASVSFPEYAPYNITAPFLGKGGIKVSFTGDATSFIQTMTGTVQSQEPYQMGTCTVNLLKTQSLANQFKRKQEINSNLGIAIIYPDATTLDPYVLYNCAIMNVPDLDFSGPDAAYNLVFSGYRVLNANLFGQI